MEAIYPLTEQQVWAIAGAAFMMLFDLVSGFAAAVINKEVSSSKMREGLAHKMVLLLFIALSLAVEVLSLHVADFGFGGVTNLPFPKGDAIVVGGYRIARKIFKFN